MVVEQPLGGLGEPVAEFGLVPGPEADEDRLVGALGGLCVGVIEPGEEGRGRAAAGRLEVELGLTLGDPDQGDEVHLLVLADGPLEELEFPTGPPTDVEDPVRPFPLVDHDEAVVVGQGLLVARLPLGRARRRDGRGVDPVKLDPLGVGAKLEAKGERFRPVVAAGGRLLAGDLVPGFIEHDDADRLVAKAGRADLGPQDHRRGLEVGLADRHVADTDVTPGPLRGGRDGVDRRQILEVEFAAVGPVAVGDDQDAGERQPSEPAANRRERGPQGRASAVKVEGVERFEPPEMRVEQVGADVEVLCQAGPPGEVVADVLANPSGSGGRAGIVANLQALAVIDQNDEGVRPRFGFRAGQERLDQAQDQDGEADRFQARGQPADRASGASPGVGPNEQEQDDSHQRPGGDGPFGRPPDDRRGGGQSGCGAGRRGVHRPLPSRS